MTSGVKLNALGAEVTPVPVSVTTEVAVGLLWMVRLPLRLPDAVGVNITLMVQVCPAARVAGQLLVCE